MRRGSSGISIAKAQQYLGRQGYVAHVPVFESDFDQGSADSIDVSDPTNIIIVPQQTFAGESWFWWCVRANLENIVTGFSLDIRGQAMTPNYHYAVWATAADSDTWAVLDDITIGESYITFRNSTPFPAGTIHLAMNPMYPLSRVQRLLTEYAEDAMVGETASTTDFIIGLTTPRTEPYDSRAVPAVPMYGFKISSGGENTKNKIILAAQNHPSETQGAFALEGMLTWLLGGSDEALLLLDWCDFYVYPVLNPQGLYAGYYSTCPEKPNDNHNRIWDATEGVAEDIAAFRTAIAADTGGAVDFLAEFHSAAITPPMFADVTADDDAAYVAYRLIMRKYLPTFALYEVTLGGSFRGWVEATLTGCKGMVFEISGASSLNVSDYKSYGQYVGQSFRRYLAEGRFTNIPTVASRTFNGTTDRLDFAAAGINFNPSAQPVTFAAWVNFVGLNNGHIMQFHRSDDAGSGVIFTTYNAALRLYRTMANLGLYDAYSDTGPLRLGRWHHVAATNTGGTALADTVLYVDGIQLVSTGTAQTGSQMAATGIVCIGGRYYDNARCANAKICHPAVWNAVLTPAQILAISNGQSPLDYPDNLKFYIPLDSASLVETVTSTEGSADGTSVATGAGNGMALYGGT